MLLATAAAALPSTGSVALADHGGHGKKDKEHGASAAAKVFTLTPSTHGNPEGIAAGGGKGSFFVGATGDGTIYRGTVDNPTITEFIPGATGKSAVGMKVADGRLYVAGGATGKIVVYDLASRQQVALFDTGAGGFLNDLVVTHHGDVFVTDSFRPIIWHVTAAQVNAGSGTPEQIAVGPEIAYGSGFNLNGIVARGDGRRLIVVQTNTGKLFRISRSTPLFCSAETGCCSTADGWSSWWAAPPRSSSSSSTATLHEAGSSTHKPIRRFAGRRPSPASASSCSS
jgi:hypothetical protein